MIYVSAIIYYSTTIHQTSQLLIKYLDFKIKSEGNSSILLENGCMEIKVIQSDRDFPIFLNIHCEDIDKDTIKFQHDPIFKLIDKHPTQIDGSLQQRIQLEDIELLLYQELNEDDLNITPEIPKQIYWDPDTERVFKNMLKRIPLAFRSLARKRITQYTEQLTQDQQQITAKHEQMLPAFVAMTPRFKHEKLKQTMQQEGLEFGYLFTDEK